MLLSNRLYSCGGRRVVGSLRLILPVGEYISHSLVSTRNWFQTPCSYWNLRGLKSFSWPSVSLGSTTNRSWLNPWIQNYGYGGTTVLSKYFLPSHGPSLRTSLHFPFPHGLLGHVTCFGHDSCCRYRCQHSRNCSFLQGQGPRGAFLWLVYRCFPFLIGFPSLNLVSGPFINFSITLFVCDLPFLLGSWLAQHSIVWMYHILLVSHLMMNIWVISDLSLLNKAAAEKACT